MEATGKHERGASLFIVMIIVLLVTLLALWAAKTALFNEMVTGNDADYQRAFEAAQAMVRDAELDIRGIQPDGSACAGAHCRPAAAPGNLDIAASKVFFPSNQSVRDEDGGDLVLLGQAYTASGRQCVAAICISTESNPMPATFWDDAMLGAMTPDAATYGQFTGASAASMGNPVLVDRAWYWVEAVPNQTSASTNSRVYAPQAGGISSQVAGIVFRITAVARGLKPNTVAVVQTVYVPQASNP